MKSPIAFRSTLLLALSLCARAEVLYTVDSASGTLCTIDTSTSVVTPIGPLGVAFSFGDLAFDTSTATLYMSDGWGQGLTTPSTLYRVDPMTGAATLVGSTGANSIFGLTYVPSVNKLYGCASTIGTGFYEIDRTTGAAAFIGNPGINLDGLTYQGGAGLIVGFYAGPGSLHTIDPATGTQSLLSNGGGFVNNGGIAWGPTSNQIYAIDASGSLFSFDVANSYARQTLATGLGYFDGLAYAGSFCPSVTAYCTAGTTSHSCVAAINSSGTPSLAASSGFTISVANVEGQRAGIFFYSMSGALNQPWASGSTSFLCVKTPTQRTAPQSSGGTLNQCDGALSIDWRAFVNANSGALGQPLVAGQQFAGQAWFLDPGAPKSSNLSNGLQWVLCP